MRCETLGAVAGTLGLLSACQTTEQAQVIASQSAFISPVADFDSPIDVSAWDDSVYDASILTSPTAVVWRPVSSLLASWGAVISPACVPMVPAVDADGDRIPASYTATFNCVDQVSGSQTSTVTGTVTISDTDDTSKVAGFTATFTDFTVAVRTPQVGSRSRTFSGTLSIAPSINNTFEVLRNFSVSFDFVDESANTQVVGTFTGNEESTYKPDHPDADPFAAGTVNLTGQGTLTEGTEVRMVTRSTDPLLHWSRDCRVPDGTASGFDSGTLVYQDDTRGDRLVLKFNGCGGPTTRTE